MTIIATSLSEFAAQMRECIRSQSSTNERSHALAGDDEFNRLALSLFALQFSHNAPYRQFCRARNAEPQTVKHWSAIPAMPSAGFKEFELTCLPPEQRTTAFHSSGTTEQRPSRHFHGAESLAVYEASLARWFEPHFLNGLHHDWRWLFLTPSPKDAPHSSLVHMFDCLQHEFGSGTSLFAGVVQKDGSWDLDVDAAGNFLRATIAENHPVMLSGTAFNFVHLLDALEESGLKLRLPAGSRVLETGGYKGRSRILPKAELHALITKWLDVPTNHIVCEYGMSELSSQAYDGIIEDPSDRALARVQCSGRAFHFPPWARVQIVSPETGHEVGEGETGLIRIFDLANVYSVLALHTEDLGVRRGGGFELLGRAALSEPRGCSLMSR